MISVEEAQRTILERIRPLGRQKVHLRDALGRVLAEDVTAPRPVPFWKNSAMDGYAVRASDVAGASREAPVSLRIVGEVPAGAVSPRPVGPGEAIRIMTGAPVPEGADAVVLVEETERASGTEVRVFLAVPEGEAIRLPGEDVREGERVFGAGVRLNPAGIGMLANVGRARVYVYQRPRVAILSTGEELVDLGETPGVGKIFNSNSYALAALAEEAGAEPVLLGIARDEPADLERHIRDGLSADLILTSGGVSVGDFDLVKTTLGDLGNEMHFWRVRMKPGKPMAFGTLGGKPVFGLPGNPVSTMVSFGLFVRPSLLKMQGRGRLFRPRVKARLTHALRKKPERRHYVRAVASRAGEGAEDAWTVRAVEAQGSNILHSMTHANALVIFPEFETDLAPGSLVDALLIDEGAALEGEPGQVTGAGSLVGAG